MAICWVDICCPLFVAVYINDHDAEQVLMMMCLPKFGILMSSNIQVELLFLAERSPWKLED